MDRVIVYPGALPQDTDVLNLARNSMVSDGYIAASALGNDTLIDGLQVTITTPATMAVSIGPGSISILSTVDGSPYGTLAADSGALRKTGINDNPTQISLSAPTTGGQSIVYLIQVSYSEIDTNNTVLSYYNASNPSQPLLGPAGGGTSQATVRKQIAQIQAKPGTPGGSPSAPPADNGWYGIATVTIPYGASSISSQMISALAAPQRMPMTLPITAKNVAYAIGAAGISLNLADDAQLWGAISAAASGAAKLTYTPVRTGGQHGSSRTTNVYLDYNDTSSLPTMEVDGIGFIGDLATSTWVNNNFTPAIGYKPVSQGGLYASPKTSKIYLDYRETDGFAVFQQDRNDGSASVSFDLAKTDWVNSNYQAKLGFTPVSQGGSRASTKTATIYLDYDDQNQLPVFQETRTDGPGTLGNLATTYWSNNAFQPKLGYTPVQQGGGSFRGPTGTVTNQSASLVYLGYDPTLGKLTCQIDNNTTGYGPVAFENWTQAYISNYAANRFAFSSATAKGTFFGVYQPGPIFPQSTTLTLPQNSSVYITAIATANVGGNGIQPTNYPSGSAGAPSFLVGISAPGNVGSSAGDITNSDMTLACTALIKNPSLINNLIVTISATYHVPDVGQGGGYNDVSVSVLGFALASGPYTP